MPGTRPPFDRGGGNGRRFNQGLVRKAWAAAAFWEVGLPEQAWHPAVTTLGVFRPDRRVKERSWVEAEATAALTGSHQAKPRRMRRDPPTLTFVDRLQ